MKKFNYISFFIFFVTFSLNVVAQDTRSGYFNNTKVGFMSVLSEEYGGGFISTVNGWHFTENLATGIGLAVQGYRDAPIFYPIYAQATYFIKREVSSPYAYGNVGYSLTFEELYRGSISYELGLGWQFKVGGITMGPEIGYRRERWQARTGNAIPDPNNDNNIIVEYTGYTNAFLKQINFGLSLFF